jgi:type IV secretion system protein VirB10
MVSYRDDDPRHTEPQDAGAAKVDAEALALRAKPRPVTRINRRVLILLSGTGLLLIFGATIFALDPPRLFDRNETGRELIRTDNTPTPEGLEVLPRNYGDLPRPVQLGPPLPGDLGGAILDKERELGVGPSPDLPFRPNPEDDAARAERIRQARLASQGRESGVFFQLGHAGHSKRRDSCAKPGGTQSLRHPAHVRGRARARSPERPEPSGTQARFPEARGRDEHL